MGFVQRRLVKFVVGVVSWPRVTVGVCALLLVVSIVYAELRLSVSADQDKLLPQKLKFVQDFARFDRMFPENDAFVIVVQAKDYGHPPLAKRWIAVADELSVKLMELKGDVTRVETRAPLEQLGREAMVFDEWESITSNSAEVQRMFPLVQILSGKPGTVPLKETLAQGLFGPQMMPRFYGAVGQGSVAEGKDFATYITGSLNRALETDPEKWKAGEEIPRLNDVNPRTKYDPSHLGYNWVADESKKHDPVHKDEKILVISIYNQSPDTTFDDWTVPKEHMETVMNEVAKGYPEFELGLTGKPAVDSDQMGTSQHDYRLAEIMGLSLVFVTLWIFLRKLWLVIVAEVCLGVGIGWTFGWATISTGRLNLLSLVFVIALIGIGMDYLIQILTRYRHEKRRYARPQAIWARVFRYVSPPISTACLGAAGAFLVSALTNFQGAGELGIIAGGGLLLCLATGYTLLPALLTLFPAEVGKVAESARYATVEKAERVDKRRLVIAGIWLLVAAGGLSVSWPPRFDPSFINLQAPERESVKLITKLPGLNAVVMSDDLGKVSKAEDALRPADQGPQPKPAGNTTVEKTESIADAIAKQQWLASHNAALNDVQWELPKAATAADLSQVAEAAKGLVKNWGGRKDAGDLSELRTEVERLAATLKDGKLAEQNVARLNAWQRKFHEELRGTVEKFVPLPLTEGVIQGLPGQLREHLVSYLDENGKKTSKPTYAVYVYSKNDLWKPEHLRSFVHEVEAKTPGDVMLTGYAGNLLHSTEAIYGSFLMSTVYAIVLIFFLVLFDLRRLSETLLAISVLVLGLPMLLLMMWLWRLFGEPGKIPGSWNLANFFALPILIGAGHEYGVFMVHRYREALHDPRRVWQKWDVSDRALLLCAIVTTCSFGFLIRAEYRGLASLGWVMAVGSGCIYLATVLVLRPILQWRLRRRGVDGEATMTLPRSHEEHEDARKR